MTLDEQIRLIKGSKQVHGNWYRTTYPEVGRLGMDPAEHYLRYGAAMGRNPGKNFDTQYYQEAHPDVMASGLNPLVHFVLHGKQLGYATRPPRAQGQAQVTAARTRLLSLGFTEQPLRDLEQIHQKADSHQIRALAARELGLWQMRSKTPEGYRQALVHLAAARAQGPDLEFRRKLATAELLCHHFLDDAPAARACYERAVLAGELSADLILASANLEPSAEGRLARMNRVLRRFGLPPVALLPEDGRPAYDRLTAAAALPAVTDGPRVTVLIAAYEAQDTLPTALRALQEQTWRNLEILVLDDCSPSAGTGRVAEDFAARDPRIRLIRMPCNAGAYVARNRGLDEATGTYVTLHDADDWSHPLKIETQVRFMEENPDVVGCTSQQARAYSDLGFTRWTGAGHFIIPNVSSFMFRRDLVRERLGYWDTVRFSGDSELMRRMKEAFGKGSVVDIATGPLSFQRDSDTSIVADEILGMNGFFFGARREYLHAQAHYRSQEGCELRYTNAADARPYPVPLSMLPDRAERIAASGHLDLVIGCDLRAGVTTISLVLETLRHASDAGQRVGIFEMNSYDHVAPDLERMTPEARDAILETGTRILTFGETVSCERMLIVDQKVLQERQRYLPSVSARQLFGMASAISLETADDVASFRAQITKATKNAQTWFDSKIFWRAHEPAVTDILASMDLEAVAASATVPFVRPTAPTRLSSIDGGLAKVDKLEGAIATLGWKAAIGR